MFHLHKQVVLPMCLGVLLCVMSCSIHFSSSNGRTKQVKTPQSRAILIDINGLLVENAPSSDILNVGNANHPITLVRRVITTLEYARNNPNIDIIALNLSRMEGSTLATATDLFRALQEVKKAGKSLYVFSEDFSLSRFLLASVADEIWLDPFGDVALDGLGTAYAFYKRAMDQYGVDAYVARVGQYKSAVEPYMQNSMSPQVRQEMTQILQNMWNGYLSLLKENKRFKNLDFETYTKSRPQFLVQYNGDAATLALEKKLIDHIGTWAQFCDALKERGYENLQDYCDFLRQSSKKETNRSSMPCVTVVYAVGAIARSGNDEGISAETFVKTLKNASEHSKTKALVVRVDSPGGDAFASEIIAREIEKIKEKMPVIVSMAGTAASGGYWISSSASEIWASPSTLTGSIGVFAVIGSWNRLLVNHGIDTESISTHPQSCWQGGMAPLPNEAQQAMLQSSVNFIYKLFLDKLIKNQRAKDQTEADSLAQGRVYTGTQALELGLIDNIGSLDDAIKHAAALAELKDYTVTAYTYQESFFSKIVNFFTEQAFAAHGLKVKDLYLSNSIFKNGQNVYALNNFATIFLP